MNRIRQAAARMNGLIKRTPLLESRFFSQLAGRKVLLKAENLQRTGSFKIRGALSKVGVLTAEEKGRGVIAASAGNHAQGVALACSRLGVGAKVVMPKHAPIAKVVATRGYGAEVLLWGDAYDDACEKALEIAAAEGRTFVHAFDDPDVIAGQGTLGLEMMEDAPGAEAVVVPVGGGGLISGVALALKQTNPGVKVIGVQPDGSAAMYHSVRAGKLGTFPAPNTIADGVAVKRPSELTLSVVRKYVDDIVLVSEAEIARAMLYLLERAKLVVEGAGALSLAALIHGKVPSGSGGPAVALLSGGNVDTNLLARIIEKGLLEEGRYLRLATVVKDRPGELQKLLKIIADEQGNVISVYHDRVKHYVSLGEAEVELLIEARDKAHKERILSNLAVAGYHITGAE